MTERRGFFRRKEDLGILLMLLTLTGTIFTICTKPQKWDEAFELTKELQPRVAANEQKLAVIDAQYRDIKEELHAINRKLGR